MPEAPDGHVEISVIMSVYNSERTLAQQLEALAAQTYDGRWELLVADNGSTDASRSIAEAWRPRIPCLRIVDASARRGDPAARNIAAGQARGALLAFCDSDDVVDRRWLGELVSALAVGDVVGGCCQFFESTPDAGPPPGGRRERAYDGGYRFRPFAIGANLAISAAILRQHGGFAEDYRAAQDVDLCWRVQGGGGTFHFAPDAVVHKRRRGGWRAGWRQHYAYGMGDAKLFRRFAADGMPRNMARTARTYAWLFTGLVRLYRPAARPVWARVCGKCCGRLVGSVRQRVLYL